MPQVPQFAPNVTSRIPPNIPQHQHAQVMPSMASIQQQHMQIHQMMHNQAMEMHQRMHSDMMSQISQMQGSQVFQHVQHVTVNGCPAARHTSRVYHGTPPQNGSMQHFSAFPTMQQFPQMPHFQMMVPQQMRQQQQQQHIRIPDAKYEQSETDDYEGPDACKICFANPIRTAIIDCGHSFACVKCCRRILLSNDVQHKKCSICGQHTQQGALIIFKS